LLPKIFIFHHVLSTPSLAINFKIIDHFYY
jgi:hypothetical protein